MDMINSIEPSVFKTQSWVGTEQQNKVFSLGGGGAERSP